MDKYVKQFNIKNSLAVQNFCLLHWRRGAQKYTLEMIKKVMGNFWDCYKRLGLLAW